MATVSIEDDESHRYVIRHRAPSVAGGEPRYRVVAVFDNEPEFVDTFKRLHEELEQRRVGGENVDPDEDFIGRVLEPGDFTREPNGPFLRRALQRGSRELPGPVYVMSGVRTTQE